MNDQQLIDALRAIGSRPVELDPAFAERLWRDLPRPRARTRTPIRRELLLVALLALAGLAVALVVGARLIDDRLLADASVPPSILATPGPAQTPASTPAFPLAIPNGMAPISTVADVRAAALAVRSPELGLAEAGRGIESMTLLPPGTAIADGDGGTTSSASPVWSVGVFTDEGRVVLVFLVDGSLEVAGGEALLPEPGPQATIEVMPTWDPGIPVALVDVDGSTVRSTVVPIPDTGPPSSIRDVVAMGEVLWLLADPIYTEDPPYLVRVDAATGAQATIALPGDMEANSIAAGRGRLWLAAADGLHELDLVTGSIQRTLDLSGDDWGPPTSDGADGLWMRAIGGAVLRDPATGSALRRIQFMETGSHPYTGFWEPPAYGSLWDVDRGTGVVHRIDQVTGATQATIDTNAPDPSSCNDPHPLVGLDGLPPVMVVECGEMSVLIDPATNTLLGTIDAHLQAFVAAGSLWTTVPFRDPIGAGWHWPGGIVQIDPESGDEIRRLTLNRPRTSAWFGAVADDALWLVVGEKARPNTGYDYNYALLRIPLAELAR